MRLKIIDDAGMNYPKVVNAETGEAVERVISIEYSADAWNGRVCTIRFVGEAHVEMSFEAKLENMKTNE